MSMGRNSPSHSRTPLMRKLSTAKPSKSARSVDPPELPALKSMSHLYKLSPVLNFETTSAKLKRYATSLTAYCHSQLKETRSIIVTSSTFTILEGLNISEADQDAVQFLILNKSGNSNKVLLSGILCCVDLPDFVRDIQQKPLVYYPLLILNGGDSLRNLVQFWFEKEFNAKITKLRFSSVDLCWMISLWTNKITTSDKIQETTLVYQVPAEIEGINEVKISIETRDLKNVWNKIHPDPNDEEFTIEQVNSFISQIELFFFKVAKLKLTSLKLVKIKNSLATISADGVLKLSSKKHVVDILGLFCHLVSEQLGFI